MILYLKNGEQIRKMQTAAGGALLTSRLDMKYQTAAANKLGEWFLKGLGAIGKIMTAPFISQGPTSATIYKSKELLAKERTIENKSEELLGKAMTWASPLNYGTALATGNGLNARKGEEEVASWSPAWLALGRAGELYFGPKAIKGIKKPLSKQLKATDIANGKNQNILGSYTYKTPSSDTRAIDFLKEFFNRLKIQGLEYTIDGLKLSSKNVLIGLPENIRDYLNENTIERNARAMRLAGYSEREIQMYKDKVNEEMSKIRVGLYSGEDYNAANSGDFGGFFNDEGNFISVNKDAYLKDPKFTPDYVMKHEGRHLIDYRTGMVDELNKILEEAYDKDFLDIPNHEDAGSLKGYEHMNRERVTTNRDARDVLLSSKGKNLLNEHEFMLYASKKGLSNSMVDFLNKIIKYAQPEDIVNAVENSNGYGRRYIKYLRENNKLTPDKIELLRLAMMHVGGYAAPIVGGGYTLYNLLNNQNTNQQLEYRKQGGKMNVLEFLKNGSGIHIKKKNRGKFTAYCGGNVTSACIAKAKASGNPTLVKRAAFAANARKWKHLNGGSIKKYLAGKQMIIPKKRTVLRTIPLSNGSKLTAEQDTTGLIRGIFWFRDNKYITPLQQKKYKFYDSNIKGYRQLNSFTNMDEKGKLTVSTPLYAPNLDWLSKTSDAESRYKLASKLLIPFKGLKIITLRTKGNMNLADVPVNMLDSIAVNAGRSNTDFWTSAALVGKESTFGGMSKTLHGDNEILYGMEDDKFNPSTLTNNHSYFSSPESDYWNALFNKYLKGVTGSDDEERLKAEADVKYAREHGQIVLRTPQYSLYVLADAFKRYNVAPNKYNPGQKNYASMVNGIKLELQGDKLLQEYWNTRGKQQYARGMKEGMKHGGKFRKFQIGGYVQPSNVLEAINNGSAAGGLLEGFGRVMSKILPKWMLKAGTYVSPLNYAAAISKGSINPKVGEEVISKWHPNLLLAARLGEAVFGGKAVKGAGKATVNTAAKAGNKTARAYLISKEIGKGAINLKELSNQFIEPHVTNPKGSGKIVHYDNGDGKSVFRNSGASIKDGKLVPGQTTRNLSNFTWWNKDNPYLNVHKSLGLFSPSRYIIVDLSNLFVHPLKAGKSVGQSDGAGRGFILPTELVSETPVSLENALIWNKNPFGWWERVKSYQPKLLLDSPASLKFFERKPLNSKLSKSEEAGIPKGERNNKTHGQSLAPYYDYSLINKHYEPWTVNEKGQFVFGAPEKAGKLGTLHFTFNEPVMSHMMGSWDDAPTVTLLPYRNVRSLAAPVDMAIMDTFFPNYKGLKISSRGAKTLTGDKKTFDYYKSKGLDVEFSPEMEGLLQQLQGVKAKLELLKSSGYDYFSPEMQELYKQQRAFKDKINSIGVEWSKQHVKPIPSYEKVNALGKAEGFDMEQYPYRLASPKKDAYGMPLEASDTELNYTWQSDPSNHFMVGEHPEIVLKSALNGEYGKVRPEFIKYLEWASKHKADYRKKGGKLVLIPRK